MNRLLVSFVVFFSCNLLFGQVDREFWFAIPKETNGHGTITAANNVSFKITALALDAHVTLSMPANGAFIQRDFFVPAGQTRIEVLANNYAEFQDIYNNLATNASVAKSGKTNRGILIQSDHDITVYYDYDNVYNRDLFSLKGKNALGTEFFTPFQNIWANGNYAPRPYSSIEIVATEDGTQIDIYPTKVIEGFIFPNVIHISLNRGEAYSLRANGYNAADHPAGTRIVSNKNIAVITNDDSVAGANMACRDIIGDQLVPVSKIGSKYVMMTGDRATSIAGIQTIPPDPKYANVGEQIFITATEANTVVNFYNKNGVLLYQSPVLGRGGNDYFTPDIQDSSMTSIYITSTDATKKFYVFHTTGIGCELGGAIIPPITDCTGSSEVSFYRSSTLNDITVNLMIPFDPALPFSDPTQSHNFFNLITYNADGSVASNMPIPGTWFESNTLANWSVLTLAKRNFNLITTPGRTHKIVNTKEFFHFGMSNGTAGVASKYGYFSSYNTVMAEAYIPQNQEDNYLMCYGDSVTMVAKGGLEYTWHYGTPDGPPTYLSDPKSYFSKITHAPIGSHLFFVEVRQAKCFGIDTLKLNVEVLPQVKALIQADKYHVCPEDTFTISSTVSEFVDIYSWRKQIGSGPPQIFIPQNDTAFKELLINPTQNTINIYYKLFAESNEGCRDEASLIIYLFPKPIADFAPKDTVGDAPFTIPFSNKTTGNDAGNYMWSFGEGSSSLIFEPTHIYFNESAAEKSYPITLVASNGVCTDTAYGTIRVNGKSTTSNPWEKQNVEPSIYPIPAKDILTVRYTTEKPGLVKVEVYSLTGKLLASKQEYKKQSGVTETSINIKEITDNLFIVKLYWDNKVLSLKGMKE